MTRTLSRRVAFVSVAALLALGSLARTLGDFAIFGIASSWSVDIEARDLPGDWKDEDWRRVVWRITRGEHPGEIRATRNHKDGSEESFRGVLVHIKGQENYLDLTPQTASPPDRSAPHLVFKLEMMRSDGMSIGTPRRVRKEFDGHLAKSFHRLSLLPPKPSALRDLLQQDSKALPGPIVEGPGNDLLVIANSSQVAKFLAGQGGDSSFWKSSREGTTVVKRRPDIED